MKRTYWRLRRVFGLPPQGDAEIYFRLTLSAGKTSFDFPWGKMEYADIMRAAPQYEEIFIRRQYAFSAQTAHPEILDCGGNIGLSSIWFKLNYPGCRLTVYEADSSLAALIRTNLGHAGITNVDVRDQAVWIANEMLTFDSKGDDSGKIDAHGSTKVQGIDLARHLPDHVDLLKLDIEGAEFAVIRHLCQTGAIQKIDHIVCEFHLWRDRTDDFVEVLGLLQSAGMQFALSGDIVPYLGEAKEVSPFEIVGKKQSLLEMFAWRPK